MFQYNPEKLLHTINQASSTLTAQNTSGVQAKEEFFSLTFELDSVDFDPDQQSQTSSQFGIHPALALLESMAQPQMVGSQTLQPIVVFNWGTKRSVSARVVALTVEEHSFDAALNPTRATVNLTLKVLDISEVGNNAGARSVCQAHQNTRKSLVDVYKIQTGQGGTALGAESGVSGIAAASVGSVADASRIKAAATQVKIIKAIKSR
jgi:hypothetical protein